jgi:hypothetical protein
MPLAACQQRRHYAKDKQVSYTVDKFPGYVRNENFKKVKKKTYKTYTTLCYLP